MERRRNRPTPRAVGRGAFDCGDRPAHGGEQKLDQRESASARSAGAAIADPQRRTEVTQDRATADEARGCRAPGSGPAPLAGASDGVAAEGAAVYGGE